MVESLPAAADGFGAEGSDPGRCPSRDQTLSARAALATAGISTVLALPSAEAAIDDLEAREWIPPRDVYTDEELQRVTARLQDLGYA